MTIDHAVLPDALALGTATLHEAAGRIGDLPPTLRPVAGSTRVAGPAFTVLCPPGDNLWIHRAIYAAAPGDVIVAATGEDTARWGYWGEIMTIAAQQARLAGLVLQGGTRDHDALADIGWPTWSLGPCIRGTVKDKTLDHGRLGGPIQLGDVTIHPGDLIVADTDGAVAIAQHTIHEVIRRSHERVTNERDAINQLRNGATTLDLYHLY
jgi:4-hydroxy-4-methyl-2-oxoglutarate aldolase